MHFFFFIFLVQKIEIDKKTEKSPSMSKDQVEIPTEESSAQPRARKQETGKRNWVIEYIPTNRGAYITQETMGTYGGFSSKIKVFIGRMYYAMLCVLQWFLIIFFFL